MQDRSTPFTCHDILGVTRDATPQDIAQAYLGTAMRNHPALHGDERERAQRRLRFAQAAEAWAVLGHAMAIRGTGDDRDANALALFEETLDRRALSLAHLRLKPEAVQRTLMDEGCDPGVAWSAAQRAARLVALGVRPAPLEGRHAPPAPAARPAADAAADDAAAFADEPRVHDARLPERVAAAVADLLALFTLATAAPALMLGRALDWSPAAAERLAFAAMLLGGFGYYVQAESAWGATPGKRLFGLRVTGMDGRPIDTRGAAIRHTLRTLSLALAGIAFVTVLLTDRRQALHDLLTDTRVATDGTDRPELVKAVCAAPLVLALGAAALSYVGAL